MSRGFPRWAASRPAGPHIGEVARSLVGILLAVVLAIEWGTTATVIAAGGSAAIAGAISLQDNPRRLPMTLWTTAATGVTVLLGSVAAPYSPLFVAAVTLAAIGAGLMWAVSASAGLTAAALGALLVGCGYQPSTIADAPLTTLLALLGGLTQVVLVAAWPRPRWQVQRAELTGAYRAVARWARDLAADPTATFDLAPLLALRDSHRRSAELFGLPERIAMSVTALRADSPDPVVHEVVVVAADALAGIAGSGRAARTEAEQALELLDGAVEQLPTHLAPPARRLQAQLHEATALQFTRSATPRDKVAAARYALRAQLSLNSPVLRHAIRLAAAAGLGTAVAAITGIQEGSWVALTVLLALHPETAHTYTRCVIRVAATIAGITLATTITALLHPTGIAAALLGVLFVGLAYVVSGVGYAPVSAAAAAAIVFVIDIDGAAHSDTLGQRLLAALLGGALAIGAHVLFPDRSLVRLHQRAGELLKTEIDYAATVIGAFVHPVADVGQVIDASWQRTVRARSAFEAASGSARADTAAVRRWLTTYRAGINAVTGCCAGLEALVSAAAPHTLDRRFVVAVDDYLDALRGEAPRAGRDWTLDATHLVATEQQLRESATYLDKGHVAQRVLVAEVETITRHLLTIAES